MKQIVQDLKSGSTLLIDVPSPQPRSGQVLIRTHRTLVSLGTEKMLVDFGKAGWISKARSQPEKVKQVLQKVQAEGLKPTMEAVFRKLNEPLPLGYCNAGEVIAVGRGVSKFAVGDRVISNGNHAEIVSVPENLVAHIPEGLSYEDAAFTVIGAIALQGIRLINPTFGETVVVTGLGLIGLIAAQLLKANGCRVIGLDFAEDKIAHAKSWGIEAINVSSGSPVQLLESLTDGHGADAVLITASTKSDAVISEAAQMSRKRGRIVLVGVVGLNIQRSEFYEKELSFQVSCSYGPGRYDVNYEKKGLDYPIGFVRWTENRNFQTVLSALRSGQLKVNGLITERVKLSDYDQVYGDMGKKGAIASIIEYDAIASIDTKSIEIHDHTIDPSDKVLGIIGAGNFTKSTILPSLQKAGAKVKYVASAGGLSGTLAAKEYGGKFSITDYANILNDGDVRGVLITTQHSTHASMTMQSLKADKHVFVEKPLALHRKDLNKIQEVYNAQNKSLVVGFNRRFSPYSIALKNSLGNSPGPVNVIATMNAGYIPNDSWVHDPEAGGGRIVGEACHLIDLISFFVGDEVESVVMNSLGEHTDTMTDNATILLKYKNGSQGVVNYFANGSKAYSKERIEVYSQNRTGIIDNFRSLKLYGFKGKDKKGKLDKGHQEQFQRWVDSLVEGGAPIVPANEVFNASYAAVAALESLQSGTWVNVNEGIN